VNAHVITKPYSFWKHLFELWEKLLSLPDFPQLDRWLSAEMKKHRQFGKTDRYWYREMIFAAIRFGSMALFLEVLHQQSKSDRKLSLEGSLPNSLFQFPEKYADGISVIKKWSTIPSPDFLFWILLHYMRLYPGIEVDLSLFPKQISRRDIYEKLSRLMNRTPSWRLHLIWWGIPLWYEDLLTQRIKTSSWTSAQVDQFLVNQGKRPPFWLRLNRGEYKQGIIQELASQGFSVREVSRALSVEGRKGIFELNAYKNGWIEIQDLASQEIGRRVAAHRGDLVWDCCAGGGGKSLQIASRAGGERGALYASDIRSYKLQELKKRARRAGLFNIRTFEWNGKALPTFDKEVQLKGGFHWVLVDAPCSASGTWRRNPDAKWRFKLNELPELLKLQAELLSNAGKAVRPQGSLVYATCSWLVQENEHIVEQFLQKHPDFSLISSEMLGNPYQNADTMFVAVMRKKTHN
jgi:16S rRNA (cytosine967-C5)-methyltransferase